MRRVLVGLGLIGILSGATGCVVEARERRPPPPPGYCPGWVWVPGHYGHAGFWHPGHWRCG